MNKKPLMHLDRFIETYEVPKASEQNATIIDLFRFRAVCRNQLILNACWLSFSMGYFGLAYNTPTTDINPFLVFSLPGIVGAVLGYIAPFMENRCATCNSSELYKNEMGILSPDLGAKPSSPPLCSQLEYSF